MRMQRPMYSATLVSFAFPVLILILAVAGIQTMARVRVLTHQGELPIERRLLPSDQVVRITRTVHGVVSDTPPTVKQEIESSVHMSSDIVRARLIKATPTLAENDSWIATKLTFARIEPILTGTRTLPDTFDITWTGGGTLYFGDVRVEAGVEWPIVPDSEMLLFLGWNPDAKRWFFSRNELLIDEGVLYSSWRKDALHGLRLVEFVKQVKQP